MWGVDELVLEVELLLVVQADTVKPVLVIPTLLRNVGEFASTAGVVAIRTNFAGTGQRMMLRKLQNWLKKQQKPRKKSSERRKKLKKPKRKPKRRRNWRKQRESKLSARLGLLAQRTALSRADTNSDLKGWGSIRPREPCTSSWKNLT